MMQTVSLTWQGNVQTLDVSIFPIIYAGLLLSNFCDMFDNKLVNVSLTQLDICSLFILVLYLSLSISIHFTSLIICFSVHSKIKTIIFINIYQCYQVSCIMYEH